MNPRQTRDIVIQAVLKTLVHIRGHLSFELTKAGAQAALSCQRIKIIHKHRCQAFFTPLPQLMMSVQVLVAQCQAIDALFEQLRQ